MQPPKHTFEIGFFLRFSALRHRQPHQAKCGQKNYLKNGFTTKHFENFSKNVFATTQTHIRNWVFFTF